MSTGSGQHPSPTSSPGLFWGCALTTMGLLCVLLCLTWAFLAVIDPSVNKHGLILFAVVAAAWGASFLTALIFPVIAAITSPIAILGTCLVLIWVGLLMVNKGDWVGGGVRILLSVIAMVGYLAYLIERFENWRFKKSG